MNKIETIIGVIEAFEEVDRYKREADEWRRRDMCRRFSEDLPDGYMPRWHDAIYAYGRRAIFEKYGRGKWYANRVDVSTNDDGTKTVETFEHWYKDNYCEFPDFMSREDFLAEFEDELRAKYEEARAEALKEE